MSRVLCYAEVNGPPHHTADLIREQLDGRVGQDGIEIDCRGFLFLRFCFHRILSILEWEYPRLQIVDPETEMIHDG